MFPAPFAKGSLEVALSNAVAVCTGEKRCVIPWTSVTKTMAASASPKELQEQSAKDFQALVDKGGVGGLLCDHADVFVAAAGSSGSSGSSGLVAVGYHPGTQLWFAVFVADDARTDFRAWCAPILRNLIDELHL
jgi:hypothetical protein